MARLLLVLVVACGSSSSDDPILEQELEAEAAAGDENEGVSMNDRYRAADTQLFEACYDDLTHLDDAHQERRRLRMRRLSEEDVDDDLPAGVAVEREGTQAGQTDELPSNVDDEAHAYSEEERELIGLETQLDAFHGEHPDPNAWSDAELSRFEDLADQLHRLCTQMRAG